MASRFAIQTMVHLILDTPDWILQSNEVIAQEAMQRAVDRYEEIKVALSEEVKERPELRGMGTTMTIAWNLGRDLFVGHIGDSRAYLFREGKLSQLTRDHTMAQAMADRGHIAQAEVATSRLRHMLTRFLGDRGSEARPDVQRLPLSDGDCLVLCTDGLSDMVPDATIAEILARNEDAATTCGWLVEKALEQGGKDNVTVVVARYRMR